MSDTLRGDKVTTSTAEELKRLWEWAENIREEVGALSDAIAKLATKDLPTEGEDEESISNVSNNRQ
jgi:glucose-6-phosphate 1-dehydrogenase